MNKTEIQNIFMGYAFCQSYQNKIRGRNKRWPEAPKFSSGLLGIKCRYPAGLLIF